MGDKIVLFKLKDLDHKKLIFYKDDRTDEYIFALSDKNDVDRRRSSNNSRLLEDVRSTCSVQTDFPLTVKEKKHQQQAIAKYSRRETNKQDGWESDFPLRRLKKELKRETIIEECECECVCCSCPCEHDEEEEEDDEQSVRYEPSTPPPPRPKKPSSRSKKLVEPPRRTSSKKSETSSTVSGGATSAIDTWVDDAIDGHDDDADDDFEAEEYALADETDNTLTESQFVPMKERRMHHSKKSGSFRDDIKSFKSSLKSLKSVKKSEVDYSFLPATYVAHQISPGGAQYDAPQW